MLVIDETGHASAVARVLHAVRQTGTTRREDIARVTGLSPATISRSTSTLLELRLLRQKPTLATTGPRGRPTIPLDLDTAHHALVGIEVSQNHTDISLNNLKLQPVEMIRIPHGNDDEDQRAARIGDELTALHDRNGGRTVLAGGVLSDRRITSWRRDLGTSLSDRFGSAFVDADTAQAAALAEHLLSRKGEAGASAYLYAGDSIGYTVIEESAGKIVIQGTGDLTHLPTRSDLVCACRRTGCLGAVAADWLVAARAAGLGLVDTPHISAVRRAALDGDSRARHLLTERAGALGEAASFVRDMVGPIHLTLLGVGITLAQTRHRVVESLWAHSTHPADPSTVSFGHLGTELTRVAAANLALDHVLDAPEETVATVLGDPSRT